MEYSVPIPVETAACQVSQTLHQALHFAGYELGNHPIVQLEEQILIAREIAAIEKGNGELDVGRVEASTLTEQPRRRTQLPAKIPKSLRKLANGMLEPRFRFPVSVQEKQINVRVGKEPSPPKAAESGNGELARAPLIAGDDFLPQVPQDASNQHRTPSHCGASAACSCEFLGDSRRFFAVAVPQRAR